MSFDLNALAGKSATVVVEFMGHTATLSYNPMALTAEKFNASQKDDDSFSEFFVDLVNDWDVKKGAKKVPLTKAGLEGVPLPFLRACFSQIMDDKEASPDEGKASSGSSRPKATSGKRRTGTG